MLNFGSPIKGNFSFFFLYLRALYHEFCFYGFMGSLFLLVELLSILYLPQKNFLGRQVLIC